MRSSACHRNLPAGCYTRPTPAWHQRSVRVDSYHPPVTLGLLAAISLQVKPDPLRSQDSAQPPPCSPSIKQVMGPGARGRGGGSVS